VFPGQPRVAIDYGSHAAVAVLAWPDGRWTPLLVDGTAVLSTAVHVGSGSDWAVGAAAWARAAGEPAGFVEAPLRLPDGAVQVGDTEVDGQELVGTVRA
jgi:hypothetical protein